MSRKQRLLISAIKAWEIELDKELDLTFKERPFLEDRSLPLVILSFDSERKEVDEKLDYLRKKILTILDDLIMEQVARDEAKKKEELPPITLEDFF